MNAKSIHEEKIGELTVLITRFDFNPHTQQKDFTQGELLTPSGTALITMRGSAAAMKRDLREEAISRI